MQSYYEINVAQLDPPAPDGQAYGYYRHLFATAERSATTRAQAVRVYDELRARFPAPEFVVTISRHECTDTTVHLDDTSDGEEE